MLLGIDHRNSLFNKYDVSQYRDTFGVMHRYSCTLYHPISTKDDHTIDVKYHIRKQKSCRTGLAGYYTCFLHELLLTLSGVNTHIYTYKLPRQKQYQETRHVPGLKTKESVVLSLSHTINDDNNASKAMKRTLH